MQVLSFVDDAKTLARASQVSTLWRDLLSDDMAWKILCEKHAYRRLSDGQSPFARPPFEPLPAHASVRPSPASLIPRPKSSPQTLESGHGSATRVASDLASRSFDGITGPSAATTATRRPMTMSYKAHFKQRYMVETAWRHGGRAVSHHIQPDQGVVTGLHLTSKYIVVALDNAKIHVFNTRGDHQKTLIGHVMGVWAMVPCEDILVSGGCDRDVRVWDMLTGYVEYLQKKTRVDRERSTDD